PRVASPERVQEQVVQDAPSTMPAVVSTISLPANVVMRLLNVLEVLIPSHGGLQVPQTISQEKTQVQLNGAATQTPWLTPQPTFHLVATIGQSKYLKNSWILSHQSSMRRQLLLSLRSSLIIVKRY
ncbi:hypothetical protein HAX54_017139, partial [Datura stramonium]|nr:hypothetical protein [Datura stramonium]